MATGPCECKTYVLSASYRQDNHAPAVLPAVVLGGDEDDPLSAGDIWRRLYLDSLYI